MAAGSVQPRSVVGTRRQLQARHAEQADDRAQYARRPIPSGLGRHGRGQFRRSHWPRHGNLPTKLSPLGTTVNESTGGEPETPSPDRENSARARSSRGERHVRSRGGRLYDSTGGTTISGAMLQIGDGVTLGHRLSPELDFHQHPRNGRVQRARRSHHRADQRRRRRDEIARRAEIFNARSREIRENDNKPEPGMSF